VKAKSLGEVQALIGSAGFVDWFGELSRGREAQQETSERFDEILTQSTLMDFRAELAQKNAIDTLYRAGECEDTAAKLLAEATDIENRSFEVVATYEEHRFKVSETWYRLGAAEKSVEELRERVASLRAQLEDGDPARRREADAALAAADDELQKAEREFRQIHDDYDRESQRKVRLWEEVERMWARSSELNLLVHEKQVEGRKIRQRAERLFREAEDRKGKGKQLRQEADEQSLLKEKHTERIAQLLQDARERFGCAVGEEFLYWRQREDQTGAYCVALILDSDSYNIEVKPLTLYRVEKQRGVEFLEPGREGRKIDESDQRFESYFLVGRKGKPRSRPDPES
jgi:hypothetical protein